MSVLLIADDHPVFLEGLRRVVGRAVPDAIIHEADRLETLYELADLHADADLLLLDLHMPGANGFGPLVHLRGQHPQLPIVIVSAHEDPVLMRRALDNGAMGFIPKSSNAATLTQTLQRVLEGSACAPDDSYATAGASSDEQAGAASLRALTPQQFRVLQMVGAGHLNKQIAFELSISEATIKAHMTAIMRKLGVSTRTQAVLVAGRLAIDTARSGTVLKSDF